MNSSIHTQPHEHVPSGYMPFEERLARTDSTPATVTHIRFGHTTVEIDDFVNVSGMTLETWQRNVEMVRRQRIHCTVGGVALSLREFEERHQRIHLGYN